MANTPDPEIVAKIAALTKQDARLVSGVDEILRIFEDRKLAHRMRLPPKMVGVHPANRNGYGVSSTEVHSIGAQIVDMGWLSSATAHAICIEDGADRKIAAFTSKLAKSTSGLGIVDPSEIKYGSLGCSHTNQFMVAALCGVESEFEKLTLDGKMSVSKISVDPGLKDALENGLSWLVLSSQIDALYPQFADLVQYAMNAPGAVQRNENEMQILVKIQSFVEHRPSGSVVDWPLISSLVRKRNNLEDFSYIKHTCSILSICGMVGCFWNFVRTTCLSHFCVYASVCIIYVLRLSTCTQRLAH